jgi:Fe2+ transport system protein FeoA
MRLIALKDPHIVEVNGRRGRAWTGRNVDDGSIVRVVIYETGGDTIEIETDELKLPDAPVPA